MRFVVVHYHIFKNAGTSVERVLEREFPGAFARLHGPLPDATLDADDLAAFLKDHPAVQAVTSHHLRYPLPVLRQTVLFDCCFVRHPLERLDSLYAYYRRIDSSDVLCEQARRQAPGEFFRHLLDRSPQLVSDVQVTQLANRGAFTRPANQSDLARALATVRDMAIPGVVEMFRESMMAAEYFMRPAFPSIRLGTSPANVSRPIVSNEAERKQRLLDRWGRPLYEELARINRLDLELVNETAREIRQRLAIVPPAAVRAGLREIQLAAAL